MKFFLAFAFVAIVSADVSHLLKNKYLPPVAPNAVALKQYLPPLPPQPVQHEAVHYQPQSQAHHHNAPPTSKYLPPVSVPQVQSVQHVQYEAVPQQVFHPQPAYQAPAPVYQQASAPVYHAPAPQYVQPAPVQHEQVFQAPAPAPQYVQPAPVQHEQVFQAPAPVQHVAPTSQYLPPPVHHVPAVHHQSQVQYVQQPAPVKQEQIHYQPQVQPQAHYAPAPAVQQAVPAVHYVPAPAVHHQHQPAPAASFDESNGYVYNVPH